MVYDIFYDDVTNGWGVCLGNGDFERFITEGEAHLFINDNKRRAYYV